MAYDGADVAANEAATAEQFNWLKNSMIMRIYKAGDEVLNNDNALQNDDDLLFPIAANEVWHFKFVLNHLSGTTPDIKYAITIPSGTIRYAYFCYVSIGFGPYGKVLASATAFVVDGLGVTDGTHNLITVIEGIVINGATPGNVQLQWAQNTAEATDTTVKAGSCLIAHRLDV